MRVAGKIRTARGYDSRSTLCLPDRDVRGRRGYGSCRVCIRVDCCCGLVARPHANTDRHVDRHLWSSGAGLFRMEAAPRLAVENAVAVSCRRHPGRAAWRLDPRVGASRSGAYGCGRAARALQRLYARPAGGEADQRGRSRRGRGRGISKRCAGWPDRSRRHSRDHLVRVARVAQG
jgi:hypothetical protein